MSHEIMSDESKSSSQPFVQLLVGSGVLSLGLVLVCLIALLFIVPRTDGVPRSMLTIAISLSKVIKPLQQRGTMATTKQIVAKLSRTQRFRAIRADMNGQLVLEFAPCDPTEHRSLEADAKVAFDLCTEHNKSFLLSHVKRLALPIAGSLILAIGIQVWLQNINNRRPENADECLPMDQIFGFPGARISLNILVSFYGLAIAAAFEQMMHIYRWSALHRNPLRILQLENLFQGHTIFSSWRFHDLPILGRRIFTTGVHFVIKKAVHTTEYDIFKRAEKNEVSWLAQPLKGAYAVSETDDGSDLVAVSQKVFLDGPYEQDIHLKNLKAVILVVEGCGTFGAVSRAMFLAQRAFQNRQEMKAQKDFSGRFERFYSDKREESFYSVFRSCKRKTGDDHKG
ncbi:uncharacterized protein CTRU02_215134 [Colletotrichum truncatum]|uniref:Uncharacterized protein n=1 Tax=Colletotrichum truncatum TaxID=5467 RepID=A0ACC3YDM6_COLTU